MQILGKGCPTRPRPCSTPSDSSSYSSFSLSFASYSYTPMIARYIAFRTNRYPVRALCLFVSGNFKFPSSDVAKAGGELRPLRFLLPFVSAGYALLVSCRARAVGGCVVTRGAISSRDPDLVVSLLSPLVARKLFVPSSDGIVLFGTST